MNTLKALREEEMITPDEKPDIYSFMRSAEIRDYMRENKRFSTDDKIQLILQSLNPFDVKLKALQILSEDIVSTTECERAAICGLIGYYKTALAEFNNPEKPAVYVLHENRAVSESPANAYKRTHLRCGSYDFYGDLQEIFRDYGDRQEQWEEGFHSTVDIDLVYAGIPNGENNPISCTAAYFDGRLSVFDVSVTDSWAASKGFGYLRELREAQLDRYSLPFPSFSRVRLQTPFMDEPVCGILESNMDGGGCWYHFFHPDIGDDMDLSYHLIDWNCGETVFDCLTSDDREAAAEEICGIIKYITDITPIAELKSGVSTYIIGRATEVGNAESEDDDCNGYVSIPVKVTDESGSITVPFRIAGADTMWIKNAVKKQEWLLMSVRMEKDRNGVMCAHCGDISRITPETGRIIRELKKKK